MVLTASYEARPFGVRSAMPSAKREPALPGAALRPPRFDAYKRDSRRIREIFARYTDLIEPLSLDEAYLDVTEPSAGPMPAVEIARAIKAAIRRRPASPPRPASRSTSSWPRPPRTWRSPTG